MDVRPDHDGALRRRTATGCGSRTRAPGAPREDHAAAGAHTSFAVAIDPSGRLAWRTSDIEGDHVVARRPERVSDEYLAVLRELAVSYVLAGTRDVDLAVALEKIGDRFGVRTVMLEGGGRSTGGCWPLGSSMSSACSWRPSPMDASALRRSSTSIPTGHHRVPSPSRRWNGKARTSCGSGTASEVVAGLASSVFLR